MAWAALTFYQCLLGPPLHRKGRTAAMFWFYWVPEGSLGSVWRGQSGQRYRQPASQPASHHLFLRQIQSGSLAQSGDALNLVIWLSRPVWRVMHSNTVWQSEQSGQSGKCPSLGNLVTHTIWQSLINRVLASVWRVK